MSARFSWRAPYPIAFVIVVGAIIYAAIARRVRGRRA
jgi:hypothetical protein